MIRTLTPFDRSRRSGQSLVEYAIVLSGVALVCLVAVAILGRKTNDMVSTVATTLPGASPADNAPIVSGKLIETTTNEDGALVLDANAIGGANANTSRLSTNLGLNEDDLRALVVDPAEAK
ncbi:MAG: hypothetical protein RLY93_04360 [Sumerlaeia bacterium]